MRRYQLGSSLFLLFFGAFICFEATKLDMGRIVKPGPGFFPFWLGLALVLVSLAIVLQARKAEAGGPSLWKGLRWPKIIVVLGVLLLYAFLLEWLGYLIATFFLMFFLFRFVETQRWWVVIFGSVTTSFVTYFLFKVWLQVQLPVGLWGM
jgi:putative tricarboxylic transport membrane protein